MFFLDIPDKYNDTLVYSLEEIASCGGVDILRVIKFVWSLFGIVCFLVPIGLIVMVSIDFAKNVMAGNADEMKKNANKVLKRFIYCIAFFLVPTIVSFAIKLLGENGVDYARCITMAKEADLSLYKSLDPIKEYPIDEPIFGGSDNTVPSDGASTNDKYDKVIFIGDSRFVGMHAALTEDVENSMWLAKDGESYNYAKDSIEGLSSKSKFETNKRGLIYINMGVNDLPGQDLTARVNLAKKYAELYNGLADKYRKSKIVVVSVNPIDETKIDTFTNNNINHFNTQLKNKLDSRILYCDTFSKINGNFTAADGLHYDAATYQKIYEEMTKCAS